ncbi:MAG TPA: ankyrin repeat domain-containing protein [Blastocatellia bacterium]|nr:ankyrin repeat domain-containing protein [Blastocatellia bacterium]
MKRSSLRAFLTIFSAPVLAYAFCANAMTRNEVMNEKLFNAIRDADFQAVSAALSGGADANAKDEDGLAALMYAAIFARADCVELLLSKSADPNARSKSDVTALMLAIGDAAKVKLLLAKGAEVNAKSKQERAALTIAADRGASVEVIKLLLDNGADLSVGNPLGAAARGGDVKVVKLLLERGADPNNSTAIGRGTSLVSPKNGGEQNKSKGESPIQSVPGNGNNGGTPLMYAAHARNTEVVRLLIEKGADVNAKYNGAGTALIPAAEMGDLAIAKLLLETGADVNVKHQSGYTALMYAAAAESNDPELIKALLAKGAEINIKAKDGETALTLTGRKGNTEIVRLLKKAGAKE